jgi:hypothetical protein
MTEELRNSRAMAAAMGGLLGITSSGGICSHMPCTAIQWWYSLKNTPCRATHDQGLALVHCSAQLERFAWDRVCA